MKKADLAQFNECTRAEMDREIEKRFEQWDAIFEYGSERVLSDGYLLNGLRSEILQIRQKREKRFPSDLIGQLCFDGSEEMGERPLPDQMPTDWTSSKSEEKRRAWIKETMKSIL